MNDKSFAEFGVLPPLKKPWWKRLITKPLDRGFGEKPEWAEDAVNVTTDIKFSFSERLVVLITGKVRVNTVTACQFKPGRLETYKVRAVPGWE